VGQRWNDRQAAFRNDSDSEAHDDRAAAAWIGAARASIGTCTSITGLAGLARMSRLVRTGA